MTTNNILAAAGERMEETVFNGRLGIQQRVLPTYRAPFFDLLARACMGGLSLFAGEPRPNEAIPTASSLQYACYVNAHNLHILRGSLYFCYQSGFQDWLSEWDPDVLIVEANPRYPATIGRMRWMKERGRPVIGWGLGAPTGSGFLARSRRKEWMRFLENLDAMIAYSQRGAHEYNMLGFPPERIYVAPNAAAFRPRHSLPQRAEYVNGEPNILFVGRLLPRKRIDNLIRACAALGRQMQPRLVIIGDGPERVHLQSLARKIFPQTEFYGYRQGEEIKPDFVKADIFVLPGSGGLAVQEAMAYGLPVIVAKGDGTQVDLVRSQNGWQIPNDDLDALIATLRSALSDVKRLRLMGVESYRIVRQEINLERMKDVFVNVINQQVTRGV